MKSEKTLEMERRAKWYIEKARNGAADCINRRIIYELESCSHEESQLTLRFKTEDWMMNPGGVLHGGLICTIMDITMGITSLTMSGHYGSTVNMSVSFLSPAPNNDELLVAARSNRVGRTFGQLVAEAVSCKSGELCATATGMFYYDKSRTLEIEK